MCVSRSDVILVCLFGLVVPFKASPRRPNARTMCRTRAHLCQDRSYGPTTYGTRCAHATVTYLTHAPLEARGERAGNQTRSVRASCAGISSGKPGRQTRAIDAVVERPELRRADRSLVVDCFRRL
ncbi:hypothetical protein BJX62DRAFT_219395 [Aspergillus germanicus]